jgi:hypothetical protein
VVMLSQSYFKSAACVAELMKACSIGKPMIPIYLEGVDITGNFLGAGIPEVKAANSIRPFISGNCIPSPNQGLFQGRGAADFERNMATLIKRSRASTSCDPARPSLCLPTCIKSELFYVLFV